MPGTRDILIGFGLAVLLTVVPFLLVGGKWLPREATLLVIGLAAIVQMCVHLRFFLGIQFIPHHRHRTGALVFACILLFIMVGGTIWVIGNLNWRMMY